MARRSCGQDGCEVQGGETDRAGCRRRTTPCSAMRSPPPTAPRRTPYQVQFGSAHAGTESGGDQQGQTVRDLYPGRLGRQRQADAEPGHPLGLREEPLLSQLCDAGQCGGRPQQPGSQCARRGRPMRNRWPRAASTSTTTSATATTAARRRTSSSRGSGSPTTSMATRQHVIFGGIGRSYDRDLYDCHPSRADQVGAVAAHLLVQHADAPCTVGVQSLLRLDPCYMRYRQSAGAGGGQQHRQGSGCRSTTT